jgi:hypothetical protein
VLPDLQRMAGIGPRDVPFHAESPPTGLAWFGSFWRLVGQKKNTDRSLLFAENAALWIPVTFKTAHAACGS